MRKYVAYFLIFFGLLVAAGVFYANSRFSTQTRTFSGYSLSHSSWEKYKEKFMNKDGRIIDHSQNDITTSEGQSYAMLRAVWVDDKETFDLVWKWTKNTLRQPNSNLFGWRWGKKSNGSYGHIDTNSASDADSDIALALILASRRWRQTHYADDAKKILKDLWEQNTAEVLGKQYLLAGNWAKDELVINPSYFAPYAWRLFAKVDKENDWNSLIDPAYELLLRAGKEPLDKKKAVGLPPDWMVLDMDVAELKPPSQKNYTTNYSYDAVRVPWRIYVDYVWNKEPKAKEYLQTLKFLKQQYDAEGKLVNSYTHDGKPVNDNENPVMYATALGYFLMDDPDNAKKIYEEKIVEMYSNDSYAFENTQYYEANWLWFGTALYNKQIVSF